ncbi:MAG: ABC transporter substrate-binding protein [Lachnospiraceae bacterium]
MKNKIYRILAVIMMISLLTACSTNKEEETQDTKAEEELTKITFVLDWTPNTNHTGLYVAQEKGYFEEAGLEVEIVQPPEDGAEVLVGSNKAQFGVSFQDYMVPALVGDNALPIEAVAAIVQHNTSGIISRKGEGIDRPKGMEGKKYATWDLEMEKATLQKVIETDGGDYSKIEMIPSTITDEVAALESKSVDAIWVYYGWAGIATEVAGLETDYFAFADIDDVFDYYTPVIIGNTQWMQENEDATKAFLAAMKKGYEYAIDNAKEAGEILCQAAPELDAELVQASQEYMTDQYKAEVEQWGYMDSERWNAFFQWVNENGLAEEELADNIGFTNDYLE